MDAWLRGELGDIEPREALPQLRAVVLEATARGVDLRGLFTAVALRDAVACAELAVGPRAIAHPVAVSGALAAAESLEAVVAPSGLYARMAALAPSLVDVISVRVAQRHPRAAWVISHFRRIGPAAGVRHLEIAKASGCLAEVMAAYGRRGPVESIVAFTRASGGVDGMGALWRAGRLEEAVVVAAAALEQDPRAPVVAAAAALSGPDVRAFTAALLPRLAPDAAEAVRASLAVGPIPVS